MRDMPGASPVPHRRSSTAARTGEARRVATVAMLLAVTVIGLRTRGAFSHRRMPPRRALPERSSRPLWPRARGRARRVHRPARARPARHAVRRAAQPQGPQAHARAAGGPPGEPGQPIAAAERRGPVLGLAAGSAALQANHEPRAAIIACYAAMEQGFAAAGSAPAAADTPAEVLARATAAGIVRSGSAEVLTGLFRRARYSDEPMTSADSAAAATALVQMRADLASASAEP
jgi:hypothetical protein